MPNRESVRIEKSRSRKRPFKVRFIGENGEPLNLAQLLTTRRNCIVNILAVGKGWSGKEIVVLDDSGLKTKKFKLHIDGYEEPIND